MDESRGLFLYAGEYAAAHEARDDFNAIHTAKSEGWIGKYQAALFEKSEDGAVKVLDTTSTTRASGAKWGAAIGAVIGLVFPPSILVGMGAGSLLGAGAGNVAKGWFAGDIKTIGENLQPGHSGILLIAEATPDIAVERILARALNSEAHAVKEYADEARKALEEGLEA